MKTQNVILSETKNLLRMQDISDKQRDPSSKTPQDDKGIFWRSKSGLTLIEVLVAMSIVTVAGTLLLVVMVNSAGLFSKQSSKVQAGLNINDTLSVVRGTIKQASAVAPLYTSGPTTYTSGPNQLVLKVASIDLSGNIITDTFDYFVIFLDQSFLHLKIFPDLQSSRKSADQILTNIVDSLNFQYFTSVIPPVEVPPVNATKIRITLTLKQKAAQTFEINTATTEANLRND